ncbi:MotA/TolQ/ExbB proton channel family protein [Gilvimarinus polysaccharolyticus]|uniref:MotA/TolQ/ExbB proton channel family protein n=1 Tax=Gilvimarinus polysaccharolyticus TaxID=863921 RepID=UPI0006739435|nr:MotA/TolQ/ExbB proton channel family protein [Gilvimarinus polysaccharolyticus]
MNPFANVLVWIIIVMALCLYAMMFERMLAERDIVWQDSVRQWLSTFAALLAALPLLGLLGTIVGLLDVFSSMASSVHDTQSLLSGGIADAMLTTKTGLLAVIPGWLLLGALRSQVNRAEAWAAV